MRIGYLVSLYPAASHTFIKREVDALRRQNIDILTFSIRRPPSTKSSPASFRAAISETYYLLPMRLLTFVSAHFIALLRSPRSYFLVFGLAVTHRAPGARALLWAIFHFGESIVLARQLNRVGISHLHNHFANAGANVGLLAAKFLDIPWSVTLHGISETDYPAGLLLGRKIEFAQFVACVSWFGRAQALRMTSSDHWHKLSVVRCGLNLDEMPPRKESVTSGVNPIQVICVARLSEEKAHLGLLEAFANIIDGGLKAELTLVGDGPERATITKAIENLGLNDVVILTGALDEAETLAQIAGSDVLVLASLMEGLPIVLMEAMALGVPVVAPYVAGIPELVEDGKSGLLFRPSDWNSLAKKMILLLSDDGLRHQLATSALLSVSSEFDIDKAVKPLALRFTQVEASTSTLD